MTATDLTGEGVEQDKSGLRLILDSEATRAFNEMATRLKAVGPYIRFYPSQLGSFLVSDFFDTYFDRDLDVLIAKFFDAKAFLAAGIQDAKSNDDTLEMLKTLSSSVEKIKAKGRRKAIAKACAPKPTKAKNKNEISHEKKDKLND